MSRRLPRELAAAYAGAPLQERLHTGLRWATSPMAALERELPLAGSVLEVGCGHGLFCLYAALAAPGRQVVGVDIDADKVADARRAAAAAGLGPDRVRFDVVPPGWRPDPAERHDAVVVIDVLYLLGRTEAVALVAAAATAVAPGGRLLVKEMDTDRRLRAAVSRAQERVSTRVTRVTQGDTVELVPLAELQAALVGAGLDVTVQPLHRGHHVPHALLIGHRPAEPPTAPPAEL